jgi:uncharacterized membrane protein YphA (DoxX/SURF4 family)
MFETLLHQLLTIWELLVYLAILIPALLLRRLKFCLLLSFMFTYYLAFLLYWGDFIDRTPSRFSFLAYVLSGFLVVALVVLESFKEKTKKKNTV